MPLSPASSQRSRPIRRRIGIAIAVLLLTLLAHLLVIEWLKNELQLIAPADEDDEPLISVTLPPPADIAPPPKPSEPPPMTADSKKAVAAIPKTEPAADDAAQAPPPAAEVNTASDSSTDAANAPAAGQDQPLAESTPSTPSTTNTLFERVSLPPPAVLSFNAIGVRNDGRRIEGHGTISWLHNGESYTLDAEVSVLLFTLLKYRSNGELGKLGIAPLLYSEKRIGRSETNTHFQRSAGVISFSASTATAPGNRGEQDRGSWIWQLASLGRGDPDKFESGLVLEMVVAGTKAVDVWRIYINGRENIALPDGEVSAWRVSVIPGETSFDKQIDVWLAPERDWYPVRMSHQDKNGNRVELLLTKIQAK
jgi:hypothetical protein